MTTIDLEARRRGIGGSDVPAILGISPWRTPLDVWMEKTGQGTPQPETIAMRLGHRLEPVIAEEYALATGREVTETGEFLTNPEAPWMLANIDRRVKDDGRVLECKSVGNWARDEWGDDGTDQVPMLYVAQVQWYLLLTGQQLADLAALMGHNLHIYTIEAHQGLHDALRERCERFWTDHVLAGVPPEPTNAADAIKLWPSSEGTMKAATKEDLDVLHELSAVKAEQSRLAERREKLEYLLKRSIGTNDGLADGAGPCVTWKSQFARRLDQKRLKTDHPEVYETCLSVTESRVLRLKPRK